MKNVRKVDFRTGPYGLGLDAGGGRRARRKSHFRFSVITKKHVGRLSIKSKPKS